MYLDIVSLLSDIGQVPNHAMPGLQPACPDTFSEIRTSILYRSQLEVLLSHQLGMLRTFYGVTSEEVIMHDPAGLRREWGAINQNVIRTNICCLMFNRCTGCVLADGGHTSY